MTWELDPAVFAGAALALALFAHGWARLRRRGRADLAGLGRAALFSFGLVVGTLALLSPLDELGEERSLAAHMLQHVAIGDVAPALLVVAMRGPLPLFMPPRSLVRAVARHQRLRGPLGALLRPRVAFAVWALGLGLWHVPGAYDYALAHPLAHRIEHLTFALGGTLVWLQLVGPLGRHALDRANRLRCALHMFAATSILASVLLLSGFVLYGRYAHVTEPLFGLSPLRDQAFAGLVMLVESALSLGACAAVLLGASRYELTRARRLALRAAAAERA